MRYIVCALGLGLASAGHALVYTFDSGNEGWQRTDLNQSNYSYTIVGSSAWNSAGYIEENDFSSWAWHSSPVLNQNLSGATNLSFDYSCDATDNTTYPFVLLGGTSSVVFQSQIPTADGAFHHYSYSLTSATGWFYANSAGTSSLRPATMSDIQAVLGNLVRIGVDADTLSGNDHTRLDNVVLTPEPGTLAALSAGALLVLRRRKK